MNNQEIDFQLLQQIEEQDEQIEKATKVIETLSNELEMTQKENAKQKYEIEYLQKSIKQLEKENLTLQKESNQIDTIRKGEIRQKQINHNQKDRIDKYQSAWADQEYSYKDMISNLNQNIKQQKLQYTELNDQYDTLMQQFKQQQNAFNGAMELIEEKTIQLEQMKQEVQNCQQFKTSYEQKYKEEIQNFKQFTSNLFKDQVPLNKSVKNLKKGSIRKNLSQDFSESILLSNQTIHKYQEEQKDLGLIYTVILQQEPHIKDIIDRLQSTFNEDNLDSIIQFHSHMHQYFELVQTKMTDIIEERNLLLFGFDQIKAENEFWKEYAMEMNGMLLDFNNQISLSNQLELIEVHDPTIQLEQIHKIISSLKIDKHLKKASIQQDLLEENKQILDQLNDLTKEHEDTVQMLENAINQLEQQGYALRQNEQELNNYNELKLNNTHLLEKIQDLEQQNLLIVEQQYNVKEQQLKEGKQIDTRNRTKQKKNSEIFQQSVQNQNFIEQLEGHIDQFLDCSSIATSLPAQGEQQTLISKANILIDLVMMLTDSQHDMIQKLCISFLMARENNDFQDFEEEFHNLRSNRNNLGILDYLDKLEQMKNIMLTLVEGELRREKQQRVNSSKQKLIQLINQLAQKYLGIVGKPDSQKIEQLIKKHKNQIFLYKIYKMWKEQVLDFSEILFEIIESIHSMDNGNISDLEHRIASHLEKVGKTNIRNFVEYLDE